MCTNNHFQNLRHHTLHTTVRLLALCAICLLTVMPAVAQPTLPNQCVTFRPQVLGKHVYKQSDLDELRNPKKKKKGGAWGQTTNTNLYWIVFSDRSKNTTYMEPKKESGEYKKLAFGQELRIAQIVDNFALVYEETERGLTYPTISNRARSKGCMGWVPMDHLLLWTDCPANENYIYRKALIVGNIDRARDDKNLGNLYKNPETWDGKKKLQSTMQFLYQMKTSENGMVLLAKESRVGGKLKDVLYGWVSPGSFVPWEQRTCLEPNWDQEVVKNLNGNAIEVKSTETGQSLTSIIIGAQRNRVSQKPETQYRLNPEVLRYPILDGKDKSGKTYVATIFAKDGEPTNTAAMNEVTKGEAGINDVNEKRSIVNIIMVIDGTRGMEKFFPFAKEALKRAARYFKTDDIVRTVKVGGVIYRDYDDGQYVTEMLPMTSPDNSKVDWFFSGGDYGVKSSASDQSDFEALNKGMETALDTRKMGYSADNCNLMFVIGDAGNALNDARCLSQEQIIRKCVENRIQLSSFLVRNIDTPASAQFRKQMRTIVMENMKRQYAKLGSNIKSDYKEQPDGSGYDFWFDVKQNEAFFIGGFRNAPLGQDMEQTKLYALVKSTSERFEECMARVQKVVVNANEVINDDAASSISKNLLKELLGDKYEAVRATNYIMAFKGKVPRQSSGGQEFWKPVIYISQPEFKQLMEPLKRVMQAAENNPDDRRAYVDAMKGLVRSMLPGVTPEMMDKMGNDEIKAQIYGLNVKSQSLEKYTLADIQSEKAVSPQVFAGLISDFIGKYRKMEEVEQKRYPFTTKRNGIPFYWIPVEDLP